MSTVLRTRSTPIDPAWFTREFSAQLEASRHSSMSDVELVAGSIGDYRTDTSFDRTAAAFEGNIGRSQRRWSWSISPGVIAVKQHEPQGFEEIERDLEQENVQGVLIEDDELLEPLKRQVIKEWSRSSRARMYRSIAELDYSDWHLDGGVLAMVTLTLPPTWQAVAPTGRDFKRLVEVFRRRWIRQTKLPWRGLWKLEFQGRGAAHLHALLRVPALVKGERFQLWLSRTWADICRDAVLRRFDDLPEDEQEYVKVIAHLSSYASGEYEKHLRVGTRVDFSGVKFSDPRRTAIYFGKHSSKAADNKEYQHIVPEEWQIKGAGPGRFWGVWGLDKAVAVLEMTEAQFVQVRRILRHVARSRRAATQMSRLRAAGESGEIWNMRKPKLRSLRSGGGWVLVNDGIELAVDLARAVYAG